MERARNPQNSLPFARGNTPERVDADMANGPRDVKPEPPPTAPAKGESEAPASRPVARVTERTERPPAGRRAAADARARRPESSPKRSATSRSTPGPETFHNPQGGAPNENFPSIQFDSKGVEFGPWLRRFVAQIRRNWFIPYAAMTMKGHVVVTFFVHKDGRITDLQVVKPSSVDAFTNSAFNALAASNPTIALPPEYPDDKAFFTVTFYFNETPPR